MDISANEGPGEGECANGAAAQPARDRNRRAIVSFIESGIDQTSEKLGIELEHIVVRNDGTPVSYSEEHGIEWVLRQLMSDYPEPTYDDEGDLLGVARPGESITIEPASQVELSAGPFRSIADAKACFDAFEQRLDAVLEKAGAHTEILGYHPTAKATDLELIPKRRYEFMNRYLGGLGPYGPCMMRGSASTQISIDYSSTQDCLRKFRLANALVPLLSLLCDNSPVFEGERRKHKLVRTKIWQECDPDRCGIAPGAMNSKFSLEDYADFVLDTPAILAPDKNGGWEETSRTFGELYAEMPMERADVEHALSMLFTDVRLKTYVEIRPADALPVPYAIAYAALVKGVFYGDGCLSRTELLLGDVSADDIAQAKEALMEDGYGASVYGKSAATLIDEVLAIAADGLADDEKGFLAPLSALASRRKTLADEA